MKTVDSPFFSIVTVCYNSDTTIARTIESILQQSFVNYEYIIIDGGSTDGTLNTIKKYTSAFSGRIHCFSEPDKGIYDAFNKGIRKSKGKYIWLVNSDDWIEPNALNDLYAIIMQNNHKINDFVLSCASNFRNPNGDLINVLNIKESAVERSYKCDRMGLNHPATLVPSSIYASIGLYDDKYKIMGDIDWFHRAYQQGVKFLYDDTTITNMSDGGVSNQALYKKLAKDRWYYFSKFYPNYISRILKFILWSLKYIITKY